MTWADRRTNAAADELPRPRVHPSKTARYRRIGIPPRLGRSHRDVRPAPDAAPWPGAARPNVYFRTTRDSFLRSAWKRMRAHERALAPHAHSHASLRSP